LIEDVPGRDAQLPAPGHATDGADPGVLLRPGSKQSDEPLGLLGPAAYLPEKPLVGEPGNELRDAVDEVPDEPTGPEKTAEAFTGEGVDLQECHQGGMIGRVGQHDSKLGQAQVRVGGEGEPVEHQGQDLVHRPGAAAQAARQLLEGTSRRSDVSEPERLEPECCLCYPEPCAGRADQCVEDRSKVETLMDIPDHRAHLGQPVVQLPGRVDRQAQ
jgi:hypothetical protein